MPNVFASRPVLSRPRLSLRLLCLELPTAYCSLLHSRAMKILDIGCGKHKTPGAVGMDNNPRTGADVIHDLDVVPYPFPDDEFDLVIGNQVIEHVEDVLAVVAELHRVTKPGGVIRLETPHYSDIASYTDPTHKHHLTTESFAYFTGQRPDFDFYSEVQLRPRLIRVTMLKLWRALGFELLVNSCNRYPSLRFIRKFWESYLCYVVRGKTILFEFEVVK
ncbi:MAG TPA: class I SAM-dependent methyltransferase [Pyrinomonadaceae bacterium]|nr:class I SAM-dependent methyltransferase [Pyrinomonadaceae bacterium]